MGVLNEWRMPNWSLTRTNRVKAKKRMRELGDSLLPGSVKKVMQGTLLCRIAILPTGDENDWTPRCSFSALNQPGVPVQQPTVALLSTPDERDKLRDGKFHAFLQLLDENGIPVKSIPISRRDATDGCRDTNGEIMKELGNWIDGILNKGEEGDADNPMT
jgi:hypothetical protein